MKIIELKAENIKNLKAVEIRPDGAVILEGKNGAGKSAILDAIFVALTGKRLDQPIRNGEERAEINVDLGTYKVRRIITEKTNRLEVTSADGAVFKSPQALLNEILGDLAFDPLAFSGMDTKTQRALLAKLVGLDFTELNDERLRLYNERTMKNREIKGGDPTSYRPIVGQPLPLEALVGEMQNPEPGTPREEMSMNDQLTVIQNLEAQAKDYQGYEDSLKVLFDLRNQTQSAIDTSRMDITDKENEIKKLQSEIADIGGDIETKKEQIDDIDQEVAHKPRPAQPPAGAIERARQVLLDIDAKNKKIREAIKFDEAIAKLDAAKQVVNKLEERMAKIDLEKQDKIAAAAFPIAGLGLDDETVMFNGRPFSQLSSGERLRVSTAIAMAMNPKLKVLFVRDGSLLDNAGTNEIMALAKEKDYQLWIEKTQEGKTVGIYIEDGEVVA